MRKKSTDPKARHMAKATNRKSSTLHYAEGCALIVGGFFLDPILMFLHWQHQPGQGFMQWAVMGVGLYRIFCGWWFRRINKND